MKTIQAFIYSTNKYVIQKIKSALELLPVKYSTDYRFNLTYEDDLKKISETLEKRNFDVFIIEHDAARSQGFKVIESIQALSSFSESMFTLAPVILIGPNDTGHVIKAMDYAFVRAYIIKDDFKPDNFSETVIQRYDSFFGTENSNIAAQNVKIQNDIYSQTDNLILNLTQDIVGLSQKLFETLNELKQAREIEDVELQFDNQDFALSEQDNENNLALNLEDEDDFAIHVPENQEIELTDNNKNAEENTRGKTTLSNIGDEDDDKSQIINYMPVQLANFANSKSLTKLINGKPASLFLMDLHILINPIMKKTYLRNEIDIFINRIKQFFSTFINKYHGIYVISTSDRVLCAFIDDTAIITGIEIITKLVQIEMSADEIMKNFKFHLAFDKQNIIYSDKLQEFIANIDFNELENIFSKTKVSTSFYVSNRLFTEMNSKLKNYFTAENNIYHYSFGCGN